MITNVHDNLQNQLNIVYSRETSSKFSPYNEPMNVEETIEFLNQPAEKISHPVLESTLDDPRLEERIL